MKIFKELWTEIKEEPCFWLMLYCAFCGGVANLIGAFFGLKWLVEHVRIV